MPIDTIIHDETSCGGSVGARALASARGNSVGRLCVGMMMEYVHFGHPLD